MADPLSLIPQGEDYNELRSMLRILKRDFPQDYQGLINQDDRILNMVSDIDDGTRTDHQVRNDIAKHIIGIDALKAKYGITDEQAQDLLVGKEDGGANFSDIGKGVSGADQPESIPRNAKLVRIGNEYRVVWDLGGDLGWAWYSINADQLNNIYDTKTPAANFTFSNIDQFEGRFGDNQWGNVAEIDLKAEDPWEDLKSRIFNQFGFVPGLDSPEIRRLTLQGYFEGWTANQWLVEYRSTDYFNTLADGQRAWVGLSDSEKNQRITEKAFELSSLYREAYGTGIDPTDSALRDAALRIVSGVLTQEEWTFNTKNDAADVPESPEARLRREEDEAQLAEGNQIENLTALAGAQWRAWVGGSVPIPTSFAGDWGARLASGEASEADLESYLKSVSSARWGNKPNDVTWTDWASTYKSQIRNTLELGTLDDNDSLLTSILNSDLDGVDLEKAIRADNRYLNTRAFGGSLSSYAEQLGRDFGYIA